MAWKRLPLLAPYSLQTKSRSRYSEALRLLEDYETNTQERHQLLKARIDEAWDDPRPSRPADEVFARLEALHGQTLTARHDAE